MSINFNVKGCVCKKPSGKGYYLSVWWFSDGDKFRKTVTLPSTIIKKSQAQQELNKYIQAKQKELADCAGRHPLVSLLSSLPLSSIFKVRENTLYKYNSQLNKFINYLIKMEETGYPNFYLESITYQDILKYLQYELDFGGLNLSPMSFETIKSYKNFLHKLFKKLYIIYDIKLTNPLDQLDLNDLQISRSNKQEKRKYFNDDEIIRFADFLDNSEKYFKLSPVFKMCIVLGLRRSEVLGLLWENIDLNNNILYIKHTRVRGSSNVIDTDAVKASGSLRSFVLSPFLLGLLNKQDKINKHVFNYNNKPWDPDYCSKLFKKALVEAGLPSNLSFKTTRSTCATKLIEKGYTDSQIILHMGHTDISTTRRHYMEMSNSLSKEMVNSIDKLFT